MQHLSSAILILVSSGVLAVPPFVPRSIPPDDIMDSEFIAAKISPDTLEEQAEEARKGNLSKGHRWANGTVYFYVDDVFYKENSVWDVKRKLNILLNGFNRFSKSTCINFVEDRNQKHRLRVYEGGGMGFVNTIGGNNDIHDKYMSINYWKEAAGTVMHETLHVLGFAHTQYRFDREEYIVLEKPEQKQVHQTTYGFVPYDLGSLVHYKGYKTKDPKYKHTRQYEFPSYLDIKALNILYDCKDHCAEETSAKCLNNGYPNPRDCSTCNCPFGYGGPVCDQRPRGCGEILNATESWQTLKWTIKSNEDREAHLHSEYLEPSTVFCTHWIQAPQGYKIEVKLGNLGEKMQATKACDEGEDGIEIKLLPDPSLTNPRNCMNVADETEIETSALNPTPVISWTGKEEKEFEITFRHVPEKE